MRHPDTNKSGSPDDWGKHPLEINWLLNLVVKKLNFRTNHQNHNPRRSDDSLFLILEPDRRRDLASQRP